MDFLGKTPMSAEDQNKPHIVVAVVGWVLLITFFGGGLLLFINLFVPFLPEEVFPIIALSVLALLVVGWIAGTCVQAVSNLRCVTTDKSTIPAMN